MLRTGPLNKRKYRIFRAVRGFIRPLEMLFAFHRGKASPVPAPHPFQKGGIYLSTGAVVACGRGLA